MLMIFGHRLMGKTDVVPGRFHIATKFYHIDYVPLIPVSSHVVFSQSGRSFQGIKIPLSGKSILCAWTKAASMLAIVIGGLMAIVEALDPHVMQRDPAELIGPCSLLVGGIALLWLVMRFKPFTNASTARARKLCQAAGLTDAQIEQITAGHERWLSGHCRRRSISTDAGAADGNDGDQPVIQPAIIQLRQP